VFGVFKAFDFSLLCNRVLPALESDPLPLAMSLPLNTRLGRYEIRSKIGEGGMGEVYLAHDKQLDRIIALKILPAAVAANEERMHRFIREAKVAAALNHPNIAHIYEIGESGGTNFIAMEFVDGVTLRELIHRGQTDLIKLLVYLVQVAEGLAKAHQAGIVHRDLKPDNVMITHDGYAKILDFGLAKLLEQHKQRDPVDAVSSEVTTAMMPLHSAPGMIMGTAGYMSPEQAQGHVKEMDQRSDIFSFGCILYEAATGHMAFEGKDALDSLHKIVHAPTPQIKDFNASAPDELQRIVRRCLAKDPERRYQSSKDVAIELQELQQELKAKAEPQHSVHLAASVGAATGSDQTREWNAAQPAVSTAEVEGARPTTSAEYIVNEIKRHKTGATLIIAALAVTAVGIAYGIYEFAGQKSAVHLQAPKMTRLTNSGKVSSASISPDGKYVAYSAFDESGQSSLWVRHVATRSNVQIIPPAGNDVEFAAPAFSIDSNYIYYVRTEKTGDSALYQVPVLGGISQKVLANMKVGSISFSPDGKLFAFIRRYRDYGHDALMTANADGSREQKLAMLSYPEFLPVGLAWSPDGKTIACPVGSLDGGYHLSVAVIRVADATRKPLTSHRWNSVERVAWLSDGSGVITTAQEQEGSPQQIWQISYPEGEAHTITNDLSDYHTASLTADSSALVTVLSERTSNIWVAPAGDWNNIRQVTSGKANGEVGASWTPDGKIVYVSRAGGSTDIWIVDADGRNQKQLTDDASDKFGALSTTADGRFIVFASTRSGTPQLWRIDIDGSNLKQLTTSTGGWAPHCSPDGRWVVYSSSGTSGVAISKVSIDGGETVQLNDKDAFLPAVSPDGKLIACYITDRQTRVTKIALLPFEGGDPIKLFDLPPTAAPRLPYVRWTPDGRAVAYILTHGLVSNIWLQPIDGSRPEQLTNFKTDRIFSFDWSRDGKQFFRSHGVVDSDVVLIKDFR
jgi:serine/threonine protein kinase/WD40 repeat protein